MPYSLLPFPRTFSAAPTRRPASVSDAHQSHGTALTRLEAALAAIVDRARVAVASAREQVASGDATTKGMRRDLGVLRDKLYGELQHEACVAHRTLVAAADGAKTGITRALAQRAASRSPARELRLARIGDLLLGLNDSQRNAALLEAKRVGDVDTLEAVMAHPPAFAALPGMRIVGTLVGQTDSAAISEAYSRAAVPDMHAAADELQDIASAATETVAQAEFLLSQDLHDAAARDRAKTPDLANVRAMWQAAGLDRFSDRDLRAAQLAAASAGQAVDDHLAERAKLYDVTDHQPV